MDMEEHELMQAAELLIRLNREINNILVDHMVKQVDAMVLSGGMVKPIEGGGMCNPDRDEYAKDIRKAFKVVKGKIEK